jgi:hypothetical protein
MIRRSMKHARSTRHSPCAHTRSTWTRASTQNVLVQAIRHTEANDHVGRNIASFVKPPQGKAGRLFRMVSNPPKRSLTKC